MRHTIAHPMDAAELALVLERHHECSCLGNRCRFHVWVSTVIGENWPLLGLLQLIQYGEVSRQSDLRCRISFPKPPWS